MFSVTNLVLLPTTFYILKSFDFMEKYGFNTNNIYLYINLKEFYFIYK